VGGKEIKHARAIVVLLAVMPYSSVDCHLSDKLKSSLFFKRNG
jgi:hypothetical protein